MYKKDRSKLKEYSKKMTPPKVDNFKTCKSTYARSLNIQPKKIIKKRDVEEVKQIVNGKDGSKFVHKPADLSGQKDFPVINDQKSKRAPQKRVKKTD